MRRPLGDVVSAWMALLPAVARVALRRLRARATRGAPTARPVEETTAVGVLVVETGFVRPVLLDGTQVGLLSTHDDDGTSSTEVSVDLAPDAGREVAVAVVGTVARAAFARGNHRTAWSVREDDAVVQDALRSNGFAHEGRAAPPAGREPWQLWSLLHDESS